VAINKAVNTQYEIPKTKQKNNGVSGYRPVNAPWCLKNRKKKKKNDKNAGNLNLNSKQ